MATRREDDRDQLVNRLADAARSMHGQARVEDTYTTACRLAVTNVDAAEVAGLALVRKHGGASKVANRGATDDAALVADRLQEELGDGPCVDTLWQHHRARSPSLAHDARWPRWGPRVVEETGLHSLVACRLFTVGHSLGVLNLYSHRPDAFTAADEQEGMVLAALVAIAVAAAEKVHNLEQALDSRTLIGQATGVLMERYGLGSDVAFRTLVRVASAEGIKVRDLAAMVVAGHRLPGSDGR